MRLHRQITIDFRTSWKFYQTHFLWFALKYLDGGVHLCKSDSSIIMINQSP